MDFLLSSHQMPMILVMAKMSEDILGALQPISPNFLDIPGFVADKLESGKPHAMTVPYDVEALWVFDDIDSVWREQADHAHQTFPKHGKRPGVNDDFRENDRGKYDFFAFHDYNPDYFVVTGEEFPWTCREYCIHSCWCNDSSGPE